MAILEGLGPKRKVFEDLEPGDYLFEIAEPGEKGWTATYTSDDNPEATISYINWRLRVLQPDQFEGKSFFHSTMYDASPEKIAMAKKPYDPAGFTYQFLASIGAGVVNNGEVTILDDFLTDGEIDLDKMIDLRFWGSIRKGVNKNQPDRVGLDKVWMED